MIANYFLSGRSCEKYLTRKRRQLNEATIRENRTFFATASLPITCKLALFLLFPTYLNPSQNPRRHPSNISSYPLLSITPCYLSSPAINPNLLHAILNRCAVTENSVEI